ncbi:hypothetical protein AB6806_19870 [Bosea sp. RCC_152_1]|uniref:hypothetical protein n=1 Tax=Bosea sp. RCC_152_1 TaxID=3239228 RepID=UPI00352458A2
MHNTTELKTTTAQPRRDVRTTNNTAQRQSDPNWKPQPCGLTREELREIVAEILG